MFTRSFSAWIGQKSDRMSVFEPAGRAVPSTRTGHTAWGRGCLRLVPPTSLLGRRAGLRSACLRGARA